MRKRLAAIGWRKSIGSHAHTPLMDVNIGKENKRERKSRSDWSKPAVWEHDQEIAQIISLHGLGGVIRIRRYMRELDNHIYQLSS